MGADRDGADGQVRFALHDLADPVHLLVQLAPVAGGEVAERLHRDLDLAARSLLVPHTGDRSVDQQGREVSRLPRFSARRWPG